MADELNAKQKAFCEEYMLDYNGTQAANRAGYSEKTARQMAAENLTKPAIKKYIFELEKKRAEELEVTKAMILEHWWNVASADPNDIVSMKLYNCRYCYGIGHEYQWISETEWQVACEKAASYKRPKKPPSNAGGYGFRVKKAPNPDCPICDGDGHRKIEFKDTTNRNARFLFAGIEETIAGIKIRFRDQDGALTNLARAHGLFIDRTELTGKDGKPIEYKDRTEDLTPEEEDARIAELASRYGMAPIQRKKEAPPKPKKK